MTRADTPLPIYAAERSRMEQLMRRWVETGDAPQVVADTVVKAAADAAPKLRYAAGKQSRQVSLLRRFVPASAFDKSPRKENGLPV
jgi:hypothetical protein